MRVSFNGNVLECKSLETYPSHCKINDLLVGPNGTLLKILTVQPGCPVWESNRKMFCAVLVEAEDGTKIPLRDFSGKVNVLRPQRR